jgi:hypothetical protein
MNSKSRSRRWAMLAIAPVRKVVDRHDRVAAVEQRFAQV